MSTAGRQGKDRFPVIVVSEPLLDGRELEYVREAVETGWISSEGRFIAEFERRWAEYCGAAHGIAVSSGTAALQLAMRALDLEPGSEVILPSCTIISCAVAIIEAGCVPVMVDSDPETWCLDPDQVAAKITPRTRAIMPVHLFGHPCDMAPLWELAERHGLHIVEDAAEAHGAEYRGRRCGGLGTLGCFSFYANKIVTTGEGGMVVTDNPALADRLRSLRNLCFRGDRRFLHTELGVNARLTNLQAAVGLAQVNTAVNQMDQVTQQNAAMVEQSTAASLSLSREAAELAELVGRFETSQVAAAPSPIHKAPIQQMKERVESFARAHAAPARARMAAGGGRAAVAAVQSDWEEF